MKIIYRRHYSAEVLAGGRRLKWIKTYNGGMSYAISPFYKYNIYIFFIHV